MKRFFALSCFFLLTNLQAQKPGCYVPTIFDKHVGNTVVTDSKLHPMRKALLMVDQMFKDNAYFKTIPEMRFRNHYYMNTQSIPGVKEPPLMARISATTYAKVVWVGECELYETADVIGSRYGLSVSFNDISGLVGTTGVDDEQLKAFTEPKQTGVMHGFPVYNDNYVILQKQGKVHWTKVTVAEYLDFKLRDWARRKAEFEKRKSNSPKLKMTDAEIKENYEAFKKLGQDKADNYMKMVEKMKSEEAGNIEKWKKQNAQIDERFIKDKKDIETYRANLTEQQLKEQAFLGTNIVGLKKENESGRPLAKLNPDFGWVSGDLNRIQLIIVSIGISQPEILKKAFQTLDYEALAALLK
jgi:hypothetical protein